MSESGKTFITYLQSIHHCLSQNFLLTCRIFFSAVTLLEYSIYRFLFLHERLLTVKAKLLANELDYMHV